MSDELVKRLREIDTGQGGWGYARHAADRIEELESDNKNLRRGLEIYERERNRYKHAYPEKTGAYFLGGGYGDKDDNRLPQFVEIVPAYGCGWSQVYEKTDKTISYEGS